MVRLHRVRSRPLNLVLSLFLACPLAYGVMSAADGSRAGASNPTWATTPQWTQTLDDSGAPVEQSSPNIATLDGDGPSVVVGDTRGGVYAFHLSDGSAVSGWPVQLGVPVNSTPSVAQTDGSPYDTVFVGSGTSADPTEGGYQAIGPGGNLEWFTPVTDPGTDNEPAYAVEASMSVGSLQGGGTDVQGGSLDQEEYALDASDGATLPGWPFFSDSVFATLCTGGPLRHRTDGGRPRKHADSGIRPREALHPGRSPGHSERARRAHLQFRHGPGRGLITGGG